MKSHRVHPHEYCVFCRLRTEFMEQKEPCPARQDGLQDSESLNQLMQHSPFSEWQTPKALGEEYGYTAKQIIRLVSHRDNRIAATTLDGRWLVLRCSFAYFLERRRQRRP